MTTSSVNVAPVLAAEGVTVRFGGIVALNDVTIAVPEGAIVGLMGPNGAGKTTLFGVLSGLQRPRAGTVHMGGVDVTRLPAQKRARRGLARTFQRPELFADLDVRDHLTVAHRAHHRRHRLVRDLLGIGLEPTRQESDRVGELLELLGLEELASRPVASLPLGSNRLVEVARAAATGARVLLLDEPSSGLDPAETAQLATVFRRLNDVEGVALLLVEHNVEFVLGLAETVTVLDFGSAIAAGTPDEIRADSHVQAAYLGDMP